MYDVRMALSRLTVNVNVETRRALEDLARKRETTVTEVVRTAVGLYKFVDDHQTAGDRVQVTTANGPETIVLV